MRDPEQVYQSLAASNGILGKPIPDATVVIPEFLSIARDKLVWSLGVHLERINQPERVLSDFTTLAFKAEPDMILDVAKQYGPLWLCKAHGIAAWHRPLVQVRNAFGPAPNDDERISLSTLSCAPGQIVGTTQFYEPLDRWRVLANRAFKLLLIAQQLHDGKSPPPEAWEQVDGSTEDFRKSGAWSWLANPWNRLAENLNWWLECADVSPAVQTEHHKIRLVLGYRLWPSVLKIIAIQLALTAMRAQAMFTCKGCGNLVLAERPTDKYCDECRHKKIPNRDAQRAFQKRQRETRPPKGKTER